VSLAVHEQGAVSALVAGVLDLGAEGFGDAQPVQRQQAHQCVVPAAAQTGLDQERAELVSIKPSVWDSWSSFGRRTYAAGSRSMTASWEQYR